MISRNKSAERPLTLVSKIRLLCYNKMGTSQVGAIFKAQKYSMNNFWKHLEKFFHKKYFWKKNFKSIF